MDRSDSQSDQPRKSLVDLDFLGLRGVDPPKTNMTMEETTMNEDGSPIKNGDFPMSCYIVFRGVYLLHQLVIDLLRRHQTGWVMTVTACRVKEVFVGLVAAA